ncbi:MAG: hypothetical protein JKX84_06460 [Flavobacteriales bacterium]|nr:hypothetical protein [Flavobacteriales bacterium]
MGFANYGVVLGGLIATTALLFLIGLIFRKRFIVTRYFFWVLSMAFLALSIVTSLKHNKVLSAYELECVGIFKISKESNLGNYNYEDFRSTILTIKSDNTFEIKPNVPFIDLTNGKWKYFDDGDIAFMEMIGAGKTSQAFGSRESWIFNFPSPKSGRQVELVIFEK